MFFTFIRSSLAPFDAENALGGAFILFFEYIRIIHKVEKYPLYCGVDRGHILDCLATILKILNLAVLWGLGHLTELKTARRTYRYSTHYGLVSLMLQDNFLSFHLHR